MVGVKYGIACLSTCIYPDKIEAYPIDESVFHNGPPHPSNEGYAYAKRMLEVQCRLTGSFSHSTDSEDGNGSVWTCVTPTNLYGPNDNFNLETSHVIPGLIHKCSIAKRENKPFTILGTGKPLRQFLYVSDFADIIVWLLLQKMNGNSANLPDMLNIIPDVEDEHTIQHIGEVIADIVGVTEIQNDTSFSDGQFKKTTSNKRLRKVLPNTFSFETIESGLTKTIHWFNTNYVE
jgi:GDP-L-fucose synthase